MATIVDAVIMASTMFVAVILQTPPAFALEVLRPHQGLFGLPLDWSLKHFAEGGKLTAYFSYFHLQNGEVRVDI